jgi:hypothetical protein
MSETNVWQADGRGITVTVKYGKGYEESWVVFRGPSITQVREDIIDYFGMDRASVAELTLSDVVVNATNLAHGKGNVAAALGATVIKSGPTPAATENPASSAWAQAAQQEAEAPAENPMLARIAATTNVDELKRLWAENQAAFAEADVMAAWKARGKALKAAA